MSLGYPRCMIRYRYIVSQLQKASFLLLWQPAPSPAPDPSTEDRLRSGLWIDWTLFFLRLTHLLLLEPDLANLEFALERAVSGLRYIFKRRLGGARSIECEPFHLYSPFFPYNTTTTATHAGLPSCCEAYILALLLELLKLSVHWKSLDCMWLSVHARLKAGHARWVRDKLLGK
jgi:hypothetical protein